MATPGPRKTALVAYVRADVAQRRRIAGRYARGSKAAQVAADRLRLAEGLLALVQGHVGQEGQP